jgi:hypothetical protein
MATRINLWYSHLAAAREVVPVPRVERCISVEPGAECEKDNSWILPEIMTGSFLRAFGSIILARYIKQVSGE